MSRMAGWTVFTLLLLALILVPWLGFESSLTGWAEAFLRSRPPWWQTGPAVSLLLAADVFLPVPSSVVSTASGLLLGFGTGALASWLGMTLGCLGGYWAGSRAGRAAAERLVGPQELERVTRAGARFGDWTLVLFRAVPVLAEASVLFAGTVRLPFGRFLVVTSLSNLGISVAYAAVGAYSAQVASFLVALAGALLAPLAAMLLARLIGAYRG